MNTDSIFCRIKTGLALVVMVFFLGCGIKALPLAPVTEGNIIAPAINLGYTLKDSQVTLTWAHEVDPEKAKIPPEGFQVFVATKELSGCEGCPFIFKPAGTVSMPQKSFEYTLRQDLHYYFRVQALGKGDLKSKYSKTLYIDVP